MRLTPGESAGGLILDPAHQAGLQVVDLHHARMLYVGLAHDVQC